MNGGIGHAVEVLGPQQILASVNGYRYFGFSEVGDLLQTALGAGERARETADKRYGVLVPNDAVLVAAFEQALRSQPSSFAPLAEAMPS